MQFLTSNVQMSTFGDGPPSPKPAVEEPLPVTSASKKLFSIPGQVMLPPQLQLPKETMPSSRDLAVSSSRQQLPDPISSSRSFNSPHRYTSERSARGLVDPMPLQSEAPRRRSLFFRDLHASGLQEEPRSALSRVSEPESPKEKSTKVIIQLWNKLWYNSIEPPRESPDLPKSKFFGDHAEIFFKQARTSKLLTFRRLLLPVVLDGLILSPLQLGLHGADLLDSGSWPSGLLYLEIGFGLIILGIMGLSVFKQNLAMAQWLVPLECLRIFSNSALLFILCFRQSDMRLATHMLENIFRLFINFKLCKFLVHGHLRRAASFAVISSLALSAYFIAEVLVEDFFSRALEFTSDFLFLCICLLTFFFIDIQVEASLEAQQLKMHVNAELQQMELETILSKVNTGILTVVQAEEGSHLNFVNKFASDLFQLEEEEDRAFFERPLLSIYQPEEDNLDRLATIEGEDLVLSLKQLADFDYDQATIFEFLERVPSVSQSASYSSPNAGGSQSSRKFMQIQRHDFPLFDAQQTMLQIIDVSNQVLAHKSRAEKKLLSLINATVSHEMRTPLNSINSQMVQLENSIAELEALEVGLDPERKARIRKVFTTLGECHSVMSRSSKFLVFVVNDMLDLSQLNQRKFRKNISTFDVRQSFQELISIQKYKASQMDVSVGLVLQGFPSDSYLITTDEQRLQQVMMNLLSNSLKFSQRGGKVGIECTLLRSIGDRCWLQVAVRDQGVGISKKDQAKLFKLFGFIDTTKELNPRGIGLGLFISQSIVKKFGGTIECKSRIRHGSTFMFRILLSEADNSNCQAVPIRLKNPLRASICSSSSVARQCRDKRILIVDDEVFNQEALRVLLKQAGIAEEDMDFANNGQEAVDMVLRSVLMGQRSRLPQLSSSGCAYGLILMDLSMPVKDGFQASTEIRKILEERKLPLPQIVACTGHCEEAYIEQAWRHGIEEVLPKPVRLCVIRDLLSELY